MSDETEVTGSESTPEAPAPAGLSVTGRARRIGGRPVVPGQNPPTTPPPTKPPVQSAAPAKVALQKAEPPNEAPAPPAEPVDVSEATPAARFTLAQISSSVLGLAAVVLIVLILIASHGVYWAKSGVSSSARNTTQEAALAAAKTCVATINTYDYRHLGEDEIAATACATGKFASDLKTVYKNTLTQKAPVAKAVQTAQVNRAGIRDVSSDGKQIDILIYGQLTLTNVSTTTSGPQYDPFGAVLTMDKVGSKWLVAKVSADVGTTVGS